MKVLKGIQNNFLLNILNLSVIMSEVIVYNIANLFKEYVKVNYDKCKREN